MKIFLLCIFFLIGVITIKTNAQINYPGSFEDYHFPPIKSATTASTLESATTASQYSPNGIVFTPKGDIKVLIICAGFNDPFDNYPMAGWATGASTFPDWVNTHNTFYTANSEFDNLTTVNDKNNISRFYYEMSKGTFRLTADVYPTRVNVNASGATSWGALNKKVIEKMKLDNPGFDWSPYDKRINIPNFISDNSISNSDFKPDFVVIVYRYDNAKSGQWFTNPPVPDDPLTTTIDENMRNWNGSGGGYAALDGIDINYNDSITFDGSGYTHCKGTSDIYGLFIHEVAHSVFYCPHYANANGIVGNYFYNQLGGWGMMNTGGVPFGCANGWERWYLGWIELNANLVNSDVKSSLDLPANGEFTLTHIAAIHP